MNSDNVSILMPSKNVEKYIGQCIDSVLAQTHKNFEFIIIDDSEDNTPVIINSYSDDRIRLVKFKGNVSRKLNYGISIAKYEYICRMDGDDVIAPDRIEKQLNYIKLHPEIDILGTNYFSIDSDGKVVYEKKLPENHKDIEYIMPVFTSLVHASMFTKKSVLTGIGGYNENIILAEDAELFLRCLSRYKLHNLQESLYFFRMGHKAKTQLTDKISYKLGNDYLIRRADEKKHSSEIVFRRGLLEYYKNDVNVARKFFFSLLKSKEIRSFRLFRYLIPSMLGNKCIRYLRKKGLLNKTNIFLTNVFRWDSSNIKSMLT